MEEIDEDHHLEHRDHISEKGVAQDQADEPNSISEAENNPSEQDAESASKHSNDINEDYQREFMDSLDAVDISPYTPEEQEQIQSITGATLAIRARQKKIDHDFRLIAGVCPISHRPEPGGGYSVGVQTQDLKFGPSTNTQYLLGEVRPWGAKANCLPRTGLGHYQPRLKKQVDIKTINSTYPIGNSNI